MKDSRTDSHLTTGTAIARGFAVGFVAFLVAFVGGVALTDDAVSQAMRTALFVGSGVAMLAIILQIPKLR